MPQGGSQHLANLATERASAGHTVTSLAKAAGLSDRTIICLENGGNDEPWVCQTIADTLGVSLVTLGATTE